MYRHCIYCSAVLGSNEAVEAFPVGKTVAFDAAKGRLWAVCPKCARWNLAPIEERWEAVEDAEKQFVDTRLRVQRENIGVARLADGTRLVRIGRAIPGEIAAWRYGRELKQRRLRDLADGAKYLVAGLGGAVLLGMVPVLGPLLANLYLGGSAYALRERRPLYRLPAADDEDEGFVFQVRDMPGARLAPDGGGEMMLVLPETRGYEFDDPFLLHGAEAKRLLERSLVLLNRAGCDDLRHAVDRLARAGSARQLIADLAAQRLQLGFQARMSDRDPEQDLPRYETMARPDALALEMALHEEQERRALEGELTLLESAWREAEEIAAIADRLAAEAATGAATS